MIGAHLNLSNVPNRGYYCDAYRTSADGAIKAADLRKLAELVATYPQWARQLVAALPQ